MLRKSLFGFLVLALLLGAFVPANLAQAAATPGFFSISVANGIKADSVGYPSNYQFVFSIYQGPLYRQYLLRRWQRVDTQLPEGWYAFQLSDRNGKVLARTRYYFVASGTNLRWQSKLGPPDMKFRIMLK